MMCGVEYPIFWGWEYYDTICGSEMQFDGLEERELVTGWKTDVRGWRTEDFDTWIHSAG